MDSTEELVKEVQKLTKQIEKNGSHDYVRRKGNHFIISVNQLTPEKKEELRTLINDLLNGRKPSLRSLKSRRRKLLLRILKMNK